MKVKLEYGRAGLWADVPDNNLVSVLNLNTSPALTNVHEAVLGSLRNPIGTSELRELAADCNSVCIVVCDITRPVPNQTLLPIILDELQSAGLSKSDVSILIATGTHRPNVGDELNQIVGAEISSQYRCVNHYCSDKESMEFVGDSPNGVPVWLNREYVKADLKITVGLIEPHFMAGFSGGRKLIMPGIAALETIQAWHSPRFLEHPNATNGITHGNPVHEESLAIAKMVRPSMCVDVTLNESNEITGVFAGDLEKSWYSGVDFARTQVGVEISDPVDIVITTCAGLPLDATYYQAVKGMVGAIPIVKKGGVIIIASECHEGIGSDHFKRLLFAYDDLNQFISDIQSPTWEYVQDQWEVELLARVAAHAEIYCVCKGIPPDDVLKCFAKPAYSIEGAVSMALNTHGANARIAVIPKGPYVIPFLSNNSIAA